VFLLNETTVERPSTLFPAGQFQLSKTIAKVTLAIQDLGIIRRIQKPRQRFTR
jgi:hypothetical protein